MSEDSDRKKMSMLTASNQKARDSLEFDPLPQTKWLSIDESMGLIAKVNFSECLSLKLRNIPGAKWDAAARNWIIPFSSVAHLRANFATLDSLATKASEDADREAIERRKRADSERHRREIEADQRAKERLESRPRPMRPEFLAARNDPKTPLAIEAIGDNLTVFGFRPRNWVGQIVGMSANGRWSRVYLSGARDYRSANSKGSRGISVVYLLDNGLIYEVGESISWNQTNRWFCTVKNGVVVKMTEAMVRECLVKLD